MRVKSLEILGFKSFARKSLFEFESSISAIVGPNGSGKSNVAEALRFVLGEQSLKSMRGKRTEDLIFNGSKSAERQNRAQVAITFDNRDHSLPVDYDEVVIARVIHRDASSEYFINDSVVRLKDIIELLSAVHIGASGHHIISQGEADRILNTSPKERRAMIEDALGLKIYHWKINESEKKLAKTEENMRETESLRREIAPHIKFLKKQVEKVEQARTMRDELAGLYGDYLKREESYLKNTRQTLHSEKEALDKESHAADEAIAHAEKLRGSKLTESAESTELMQLREEMGTMRRERDALTHKIGRLEGMIEYEDRRLKSLAQKSESAQERMISSREIEELAEALRDEFLQAEKSDDFSHIKGVLSDARIRIVKFLEHLRGETNENTPDTKSMEELDGFRGEHATLLDAQKDLGRKIGELENRIHKLEAVLESKRAEMTEAEMASFESRAKKQEISLRLSMLHEHIESLDREDVAFKEELREGGILVGRSILDYVNLPIVSEENTATSRGEQEARRKKIERLKIRLEEAMGGGSGEDIMREYQDATERDEFLARELDDLKKSAESLHTLCRELEETLGLQFKEGITKINKQFGEFFTLMFDGGTASLNVSYEKKKKHADTDIEEEIPDDVDNDGEAEEGIEVAVSLPHKKIRGLQMLSGGERALTSIALIFAVSQVNPPPFLVLDETDAALDEANSKKYGDMVTTLSKYSQLIVITHNRETMSRAGIIYGITMSSDAISKLLSIKFDEAVQLAK